MASEQVEALWRAREVLVRKRLEVANYLGASYSDHHRDELVKVQAAIDAVDKATADELNGPPPLDD